MQGRHCISENSISARIGTDTTLGVPHAVDTRFWPKGVR